jgi:hypothetical protein
MIGIAYLNEIMRSHPLPSTDYILNQLRTKIIDGVLGTSKDGMDMALCRICWKEKKVQFSGANNPLWVVNPKRTQWPETTRPLAEGLMGAEFRPDKMPIGEHDLKDKPFTLHEFQAEEGDMIYLFSDGYADQFGGDRGKKLMYRRFKDLLLECAHLPVKKQMSYLDNHMQTWMSGYEQVDDILVIGIRF